MPAGRLVVLGDVMTDITALVHDEIAYGSDTRAQISMQAGGAAANTAAWASRMGVHAVLVAAIGDDDSGRGLRGLVEALGVEPLLSVVEGARTGACIVLVDRTGQRTMFPDAGANAELDCPPLELSREDHVHVSGYSLFHPRSRMAALAAIDQARSSGATSSLDPASQAPAYRYRAELLEACSLVDVILANQDEAEVLTGVMDPERAALALAGIAGCAVVKRGADGVTCAVGTEVITVPSPAAQVVDTTGAGDAFAAGFLPAWRAGQTLHEALDAGQRVAAQAIARVGAGPGPAPA